MFIISKSFATFTKVATVSFWVLHQKLRRSPKALRGVLQTAFTVYSASSEADAALHFFQYVIINFVHVWYYCMVGYLPTSGKEVSKLEFLFAFLSSVAAGVISYYICKWLDRVMQKIADQHK